MFNNIGKALFARLLAAQAQRRLIAAPLAVNNLPERLSPQLDIAVICHGRNTNTGGFDWAYAYLPNANANDKVLSKPVRSFLHRAATKNIALLAGLCPSDPFYHPELLLEQAIEAGFCGVHNFPSVCLLDGSFRTTLEQNHLGFHKEVAFMKLAADRGIFTFAMVASTTEALFMRDAGVHAITLVPAASLWLNPEGITLYREECQRILNLLQKDTFFFCCWPESSVHAKLAYFLQDISGFYGSVTV